MILLLRRLVSPLLRHTRPLQSACSHCGWPWDYAKQHRVEYFRDDRQPEPNAWTLVSCSIFICCTFCWPKTTPEQRYDYVTGVVLGTATGWRHIQAWPEDKAWQAINAVMEAAA